MTLTLDLHDVQKTYRGKIPALRGVSMQVHPGEVFGLLGPNGAGKSTLVKILMTVVKPDAVKGTMLGKPIGDKNTLRRVGYLPEHHRFPEYMTGEQVLDYFGALADVPRDIRKKRIPELLELVTMREWATTKVTQYSKGMRQRVGIAQSLMSDPDLVLLDEPTDGVDPVGRRDIRNVLAELKRRGKSVMVNSHILSELEMVCDRVAIMVQGQVARQGTIQELTSGRQQYDIELAHAPDGSVEAAAAAAPAGLTHSLSGMTMSFPTSEPEAMQPVIDALRRSGATIRSIKQHRPTLEDLFMEAIIDEDGKERGPGAKRPGVVGSSKPVPHEGGAR